MSAGTGMIHVYYGDGKGKTTAAVGLCARAAGAGLRVTLVQFLKSAPTGELEPLERLGVAILRGKAGAAFSFRMTDKQKRQTRALHDENLRRAVQQAGESGLLVLDEALGALARGLLDEELLRVLVEQKPPELELVLTGRNPPAWLIDRADYVSEFLKEKHPFDRAVPARRGVEF